MTVDQGPGALALGVSRETYDRLSHYADLLDKWTQKINLISRNDRQNIWTRHIQDSVQVYRAAPAARKWADLGSGGGLPGLVIAILAAEEASDTKIALIESNARKATFLRTVARECELTVNIVAERIEAALPQQADVISARALADIPTLLALSARHAAPNCTMIFPKGKCWRKEVENAQARWNFAYRTSTSETDPEGLLLIIEGVSRD